MYYKINVSLIKMNGPTDEILFINLQMLSLHHYGGQERSVSRFGPVVL